MNSHLIPVTPQPTHPLRQARRRAAFWFILVAAIVGVWMLKVWHRDPGTLLNVSFDASRDFFAELNAAWETQHADHAVRMVHAGSVRQGQAVARGLVADVVSFASAAEIDSIAETTGLIRRDWRAGFPYESSPYTSTIVFVVRPGNPLQISDWPDLRRPNVKAVAPSPRVSGGGRYAWLAAELYAPEQGSRLAPSAADIYEDMHLVELGARRALHVFLSDRTADVFLTWESEALRLQELEGGPYCEIVYPSVSIHAEPVVAIVDTHVERRATRRQAEAYLRFLFSNEGQRLAVVHGWRPRDPTMESAGRFPEISLRTVEEAFGGWSQAHRDHFSADGRFEVFMRNRAALRGGRE